MKYFKTGIMLLAAAFMIFFASATLYADAQYFCNGKIVNAGATKDQVKETLGKPLRIEQNKSQNQNNENNENENTVTTSRWYYNCDNLNYVFLFQNDVLVSIYQIAGTNPK